jgi:hypothetical protein
MRLVFEATLKVQHTRVLAVSRSPHVKVQAQPCNNANARLLLLTRRRRGTVTTTAGHSDDDDDDDDDDDTSALLSLLTR